jgi:hypothetical protein
MPIFHGSEAFNQHAAAWASTTEAEREKDAPKEEADLHKKMVNTMHAQSSNTQTSCVEEGGGGGGGEEDEEEEEDEDEEEGEGEGDGEEEEE